MGVCFIFFFGGEEKLCSHLGRAGSFVGWFALVGLHWLVWLEWFDCWLVELSNFTASANLISQFGFVASATTCFLLLLPEFILRNKLTVSISISHFFLDFASYDFIHNAKPRGIGDPHWEVGRP